MPANGESIDAVTTSLFVAALQGVGPVLELARQLPPRAVCDVILNTLPDDWRDANAVGLLNKLNDTDGGLLLAWICRQWWDAYSLGQVHSKAGEDLTRD